MEEKAAIKVITRWIIDYAELITTDDKRFAQSSFEEDAKDLFDLLKKEGIVCTTQTS